MDTEPDFRKSRCEAHIQDTVRNRILADIARENHLSAPCDHACGTLRCNFGCLVDNDKVEHGPFVRHVLGTCCRAHHHAWAQPHEDVGHLIKYISCCRTASECRYRSAKSHQFHRNFRRFLRSGPAGRELLLNFQDSKAREFVVDLSEMGNQVVKGLRFELPRCGVPVKDRPDQGRVNTTAENAHDLLMRRPFEIAVNEESQPVRSRPKREIIVLDLILKHVLIVKKRLAYPVHRP